MSHVLYRIQPTRTDMLTAGPTARDAEIAGRQFAYLQELAAGGIVVMAGRTLNEDASAFGVVVRAPSEAEARKLMQHGPAVSAGVMRAELFPYRIALLSPHGWPEDKPDV